MGKKREYAKKNKNRKAVNEYDGKYANRESH